MKKKILLSLAAFAILWLMMALPADVAYASSEEDKGDALAQIRAQLEAIFENVDQETASDVFDFLKEKMAEGSLTTEEGREQAIAEGKEKFGISISAEDAKKLVDVMEKLESMGFSSENLAGIAEKISMEQVSETLADTVKNAAGNAVNRFFDYVTCAVKDFFTGLFS